MYVLWILLNYSGGVIKYIINVESKYDMLWWILYATRCDDPCKISNVARIYLFVAIDSYIMILVTIVLEYCRNYEYQITVES